MLFWCPLQREDTKESVPFSVTKVVALYIFTKNGWSETITDYSYDFVSLFSALFLLFPICFQM